MYSHYEVNVFKVVYIKNLIRMHMTSSPSLLSLMPSQVHVRGRVSWFHSLNSFAEFSQHHIESPEASSCLTSKAKPISFVKPFSLKPMASGKSARKGGGQCRDNTTKDLPPDLYELYKSDL